MWNKMGKKQKADREKALDKHYEEIERKRKEEAANRKAFQDKISGKFDKEKAERQEAYDYRAKKKQKEQDALWKLNAQLLEQKKKGKKK